jgi:hypothetical protein
MQKKLVIVVISGLIVVGICAGFLYWYSKKENGKEIVTSVQELPVTSPTSVPQLLYENASGFSFEYPETVTISENEKDTTAYGSIVITSDTKPGRMTIRVVDTKATSASQWFKDADITTKNADSTSVPFADIEATQTATSGGLLTVSVDYNKSIKQGAAFIISLDWDGEEEFWQKVYDTILETFAFTEPEEQAPQSSGSSSSSDDSGIIFEGEEIIE